ncbi:mitochondrial cytochrome c oxidase assembly factor [Histoplasma capsulatum G186AR]|uniref:Mitochondrial cytochrome c oxidase assembly factor n=1 Tax=Ajellomyces capsulatus TaxID=5037 RepID=A0A8H8D727_AJECA|nr:mitochondrial cytochrome c oxidase assembly factor [Histoplasma capsulatum]QSS68992.1 mitochondrial cytochrome c oxidase assembly factor [Histoplasma capsulatum G186AR]
MYINLRDTIWQGIVLRSCLGWIDWLFFLIFFLDVMYILCTFINSPLFKSPLIAFPFNWICMHSTGGVQGIVVDGGRVGDVQSYSLSLQYSRSCHHSQNYHDAYDIC